ncbi:hypothetical protein GCM10009677_14420 [Sphaerisporangium rubeum]
MSTRWLPGQVNVNRHDVIRGARFSMVTLAPNCPPLSQVFTYVTRHVAGGIAAIAGTATATTAHTTIPATIARIPRYRVLHRTTTPDLLRTRESPHARKEGGRSPPFAVTHDPVHSGTASAAPIGADPDAISFPSSVSRPLPASSPRLIP